MRNRTLSQPFHVPCQRPLQALAEQSTDWEASLKSLDSSLKPSRERAALQFQVLGHEVAGLGYWGLATKYPGHAGQGYTHTLKALPTCNLSNPNESVLQGKRRVAGRGWHGFTTGARWSHSIQALTFGQGWSSPEPGAMEQPQLGRRQQPAWLLFY